MTSLRMAHAEGLCCPTAWMLEVARLLDNKFIGFEIGHHFCKATHPKYDDAYGIS